ncbi:MAG: hypothetical protein IT314_17030 [Anaerolineales bacterium]|nr:hypothetical protein [Anaerolineales bacterium]
MTSFVQIVVNVPAVAGVFDYAVPESLAGRGRVCRAAQADTPHKDRSRPPKHDGCETFLPPRFVTRL